MARRVTDIGRSGEFLAAYILETHGVEVHHVDRAGADLWCRIPSGLVTVQVKSSSAPRLSNAKASSLRYPFHTRSIDADWACFVALDRELLLLRPVSEVLASTTWISTVEYNEVNQRRTIDRMLGG